MFEVPIFDLLLIAFLKSNDAAGSEPYSNELLWNYDHYSYLPRQEDYIDEHEPYLNVLLLQNSDNYPSSQRNEYYPDEHEPYTNELLQNLDHYPYFQRHKYYPDEHELYTNELLQNLNHYPSSPRREYYPDEHEPYSTVLLQNSDHYPSSQRHEYYPDKHEPYTNGHLEKSDRSYYTPLNKYVLIESRTPKKYLQTEGITKSVESTEIRNLLFDDDLPLYIKKVVKTELWPTFFSTKYAESLPFKGYDEGNGQFESKLSKLIPSVKTKNQEFLSKWLRDYTATGIQTKKKYSSIDMGDNESHDNHKIVASLEEIISSEKGQLGMKHPPSNPIQSSESLYETLSNMERERQIWVKSQPSSPIQTEKSFEKILSNLLGQLWTRHQLPVAIRSNESLEENLLDILDQLWTKYQSSNPIHNSESLEENLLSKEDQLWIKYKPSTTFQSGESIRTILSNIKGHLLTDDGPTNPTQTGESLEEILPILLDQLWTKPQLSNLQKSNENLEEILLNLLSQLWTKIQSSNPILRSESSEENLSGREDQSWTKHKPSISFQNGESLQEISPNIEGWFWINNEPSIPKHMEKLLEETPSNLLDNFRAQNPLINPVQNRAGLEEILLNVKGQLKTEHQPSNTIKRGVKLVENQSNVLDQLGSKNQLTNYVQNGESLEEVLSFIKDKIRSKHQPSNSIESGESFEKILSNIKIQLRMEDQPFGLEYSRDYGTSEIQAEKETPSNGAHEYDKSRESLEKVISIKKDQLTSNDLTFNQNGNQMLLAKDISSLIFKGMDTPYEHVIEYETPLSFNEGKYIRGEQIVSDANKIFNTMPKLDNDFLGTRNDNDEKQSLDQREYEALRQTQVRKVSKSNFTEHNSSASSNKSFENQELEQEISNKNAKLTFQEGQNSDIKNHYNGKESKNTSHGSDEDEIKDQMVKNKVRNHTWQPGIDSDEVTYGVLNTVIKNQDASNANENQDVEQKTEDQNDKNEYEQDDPFIHGDSDNNFQEEQYFDSLTYGKSHVQIPNPPKDVNKADGHEKEKLNFNQSIKQNDSLTYDTTESNVHVEEDFGRLKSNIHDEQDFGSLESITLAGQILNPSKSNIQYEKDLSNLESNTQAELVFGPSEGNIQDKQIFDSLPESSFKELDPLKGFQEANKQRKYEINDNQSMKQNNKLTYVNLESNIQDQQDFGSFHDNAESNIEMSYPPKDNHETHKNKKDELSDNQSTEEINNSNPKGSLVKLVNLKDYLKDMYSKANNTNENITFFQEERQNMQRHSESLSNHILGSVYKFYDYFKSLYTNPNSSNEQKPSPALRMTEEAVTDSYGSVTDDLGNSGEGSSNNAYALLSDNEAITNRRKRSSGNIFKTHDQGDKKKTKKQNHKIIHKLYTQAMKKPKWHSGKSFRKSI